MATRRQFNKVVITGCPVIPRGTNTQGGTVIGDYVQVEKKAGKKAVRKTPAQKITESIERRLENLTKGQEVTHA